MNEYRGILLSAMSTTKRKKAVSWSTKFVCLASKNCFPDLYMKRKFWLMLVYIDCTAAFPNLSGAGGFENSRLFEPLSTSGCYWKKSDLHSERSPSRPGE